MDLWDVAKVMWRRRWVAVPLLLLSLVAAVFALLTVPPDYTVKGQIAVIPPSTVSGNLAPGSTVNPFTVEALAELVAVYLNRAEVKRQLKAVGLSPEYEITVSASDLTMLELAVEGKTAEQTTQTTNRLIGMVQQEFRTRQSTFKLAPGTEINTNVLDRGEEIEVVRTVGKRTLIVIVGVGVLVTVGVSLWVDALIRRRKVRGPVRPPARFAVPVPPSRSPSPGPLPRSVPPAGVLDAADRPASRAEDRSDERVETVPLDDYADNDSTIVLPLAGVSWSGGKPKGKQPEQQPDPLA